MSVATLVDAETLYLPDDLHVRSLDVRNVPPRSRYSTIRENLAELPCGGTLRLINDRDPRPLRLELEHDRPGCFDWMYVTHGPDAWQVDIHKCK